MPPTSSVSDIVDLIRSQWALYYLEDISEYMYCEDVDPKKSKHYLLLTFQGLSSQVGCTYPSSCLSRIFLGRRSKDLLLWFAFFDSCLLTKIGEKNTGDNELLADIQPVLTL